MTGPRAFPGDGTGWLAQRSHDQQHVPSSPMSKVQPHSDNDAATNYSFAAIVCCTPHRHPHDTSIYHDTFFRHPETPVRH